MHNVGELLTKEWKGTKVKKMLLGGIVAIAVMSAGIVGMGSGSSEAALWPGGSLTPYKTATPSSTNPGPCITFPSGRIYCGN